MSVASVQFVTDYRIYSINYPGRLFNLGLIKVGAYSRWVLIIFPIFSARTFSENNKIRENK